MILDAQNYAIQLSDSSLTPLVNINAGESLASPSAGSGITSNWYTTGVSIISGNASSGDNTTYQNATIDYPYTQTLGYLSQTGSYQLSISHFGSSPKSVKAAGQGSYATMAIWLQIWDSTNYNNSSSLEHEIFLSSKAAYGYGTQVVEIEMN